ncbi:MAG: Gfo/Idh/MocA family oxidoreductase [bacterium]
MVGTGKIIPTHLNALKKIPAVNVVGIYGRDPTRTSQIAHSFGLKPFKSFQDILSNPNIQIIDIANSSDLHADYALEACRYHKNLIIEKPIDTSIEKASEIVKLCKENNCTLGVIYQNRFNENIVLLKKLIDQNLLGRLTSGSIIWRQRRDIEYYLRIKEKWKGVLINNGIHFIDLLIYLIGEEPTFLKGFLKKTRPEIVVEDYANLLLEFENGRIFTIDLTTNVKKSLPTIIEINGEKGSIIFREDKIQFTSIDIPLNKAIWTKGLLKLYLARKYKIALKFQVGSHVEVFQDYCKALEKQVAPNGDGEDALKSLKVVNSIYSQIKNFKSSLV